MQKRIVALLDRIVNEEVTGKNHQTLTSWYWV